tara:strand:- start:235 stop:408 length:174 start_codon:yes stop_codon:yes gene_type:complete
VPRLLEIPIAELIRPYVNGIVKGETVMPMVKGKKYPYTKAGKKAAAKARKKTKKGKK